MGILLWILRATRTSFALSVPTASCMPAGTGLLGARRRWLQTPIGAVRGFLALDTHDNPNIAYVTSYVDVMYANWTGTVWSSQKVGTVPEADGPCYLALDSSGIPHISFRG